MNYRKAAQGATCTNCGIQDDTVVLAHYSGLRQHQFGKGRGIKGKNYYAAPQCHTCHESGPFAEGYIDPEFAYADRYSQKVAKSEHQLLQILEWHEICDTQQT